MSTFVTLGNATQPFERLLKAVESAMDLLPKPVLVQHGATPLRFAGCEAFPFMGMDEFGERIRESSLLIMHAGAGSLVHAVDAGKVPIVMPRERAYGEHVDDHQVELSEALAAHGRVILVRSGDELLRAIPRALETNDRLRPESGEVPLIGLVRARLAAYAGE